MVGLLAVDKGMALRERGLGASQCGRMRCPSAVGSYTVLDADSKRGRSVRPLLSPAGARMTGGGAS